MKVESTHLILDAISHHPEIPRAAITGSLARRGGEDPYSDLDLLVVARDVRAIRDVHAWFPQQLTILIHDFHLNHYCSILMDDFAKIDLAIFSVDDAPSSWVVHDYRVLKGGHVFKEQLELAAMHSRNDGAAHLHRDVSMDNVLLLMMTAFARAGRGEELSAHAFLGMAADMVISLEKRQQGVEARADLLDPRRRLETTRVDLARTLHQCLFDRPDRGIKCLAKYLSERHGESMVDRQGRVLCHLLTPECDR